MEPRDGHPTPSPLSLPLAILAGFLLLALILANSYLPYFYANPFLAPEFFSTFTFIRDTLLSFLVATAATGSVAATLLAEGRVPEGNALDRFARICYLITMFGLLAVVAVFLFEFLGYDAVLFLILEAALVALFLVSYVSGPGRARRPSP